MKTIKIFIYRTLKRLHLFIGILILKIDIDVTFDLKIIRKSVGIYYEAKGYTKNKTRKRKYIIARQVFSVILTNNTDMSLDEIGKHICNQTHANIIYSHKCIDYMIETNIMFANKFFKLMKSLNLEYKKYNTKRNIQLV